MTPERQPRIQKLTVQLARGGSRYSLMASTP